MTGTIPKEFITDLIARTDIVEIIDARVTLKKKGSNYSACCPFHNEKTPSFSVSHSKQFYHCFGCGAHGNAISFLMEYDRLEFPEAVEELAKHIGATVPRTVAQQSTQQKAHASYYELLAQIPPYYQSQLASSQTALAYLTNRGLTQETLQHFAIGFAPKGWDNVLRKFGRTPEQHTALIETGMLIKNEQQKVYDRFRDRIMIPIRDSRGRVIGFGGRTLGDDTPKYLNSPETPLFHKGSELYGFYEARQANHKLEYAIVVEGYMDVIALHQFGITQAVATLGTATSEKHLQRLFRHTDTVIICFDGDRAGKDAAWRALEVGLSVMRDGLQIKFMFLPEGEDPDSLIRQQGLQAFQQIINSAITLPDFFFDSLSKQTDISTVEGKAKLSQLAYPLIQKIRPGVFQTLMTDQLSALLGISANTLDHLHPQKPRPPLFAQTRAAKTATPNKTKLLSPIQLAITLLLQHPKLANSLSALPEVLRQLNHPGIDVFVQIFDLLKKAPHLTTGAIIENWRESKVGSRLAELANWELLIPEEGLIVEFHDTLKKVAILEREKQIQILLGKAKEAELIAEEKEQLITLLKRRH